MFPWALGALLQMIVVAPPELRPAVRPLSKRYSSGQRITVEVLVTNVGVTAATLPANMSPRFNWLDFIVVAPNGERLPFVGVAYRGLGEGEVVLLPTHKFGADFDLRQYYAIKTAGLYQLAAIYRPPRTQDGTDIPETRSSTVTFVVE